MNFKKLDIDYASKLTDKQRRWLYKFLIEYHHGVFLEQPIHDKKLRKLVEKSRRAFRKDIWNNFKKQLIALENQETKQEGKSNGRKKESRTIK